MATAIAWHNRYIDDKTAWVGKTIDGLVAIVEHNHVGNDGECHRYLIYTLDAKADGIMDAIAFGIVAKLLTWRPTLEEAQARAEQGFEDLKYPPISLLEVAMIA